MAKDAFAFSGDDALNYDSYLGPLLFEPSSIEFLSRLNYSAVGSILELAAGTGRMTKHLREYVDPATKITVTDINGDMLRLAKNKLNDSGLDFQLADIQDLPFPDHSFDLVLCQYGLMFLPDKQKGFREVFRVLKPGGRFVFSTWDSTRNIPLLNLIFDESILPFFKEEDAARLTVPFSLFDPEKLRGFLQETGFTHNKVELISFKSGASTVENVVNGFFLKHPLGRSVGEKDPAAVEALSDEMTRRLYSRFGSGEIVFDLQSFISSGQKEIAS
jgi:ubiquinone/menaquinone biosynthesis C-methylase UbiE